MFHKKQQIFLFLLFCLLYSSCQKSGKNYTTIKGEVFGTYYTIHYHDVTNYEKEVKQLFKDFDNSLSTYNKQSIISRINTNDTTVKIDSYFETMFRTAVSVYQQTNGAFDITVAPLVGAWGFGAMQQEWKQEPNVEQILPYIGLDKITIKEQKIKKKDPRIMLDASAIAKGQSCDVIADFLNKKDCKDYMIEIGGEVRCKGYNAYGEKWKIGIDKPYDDPANENSELQTILSISNKGLATSGNYRQYYYKNNKKYAHTIDPTTGYPVNHNLLSATVIAQTTMIADAYATAFMVLGAEKSIQICNQIPQLECYLILENPQQQIETKYSNGLQQYLTTTQ